MILGVGLTLAGACPGTVSAQVGAWLPSALWTLAGGFIGGVLFGEIHTRGTRSNPNFLKTAEAPTIDRLLKTDYLLTACVFSASFTLMVYGFDWAFPWRSELSTSRCFFSLPPLLSYCQMTYYYKTIFSIWILGDCCLFHPAQSHGAGVATHGGWDRHRAAPDPLLSAGRLGAGDLVVLHLPPLLCPETLRPRAAGS